MSSIPSPSPTINASSTRTKEEIKAQHRLVTDCNIFHGFMFALSIGCVGLVSLVFGYLAGTDRVEKEVAGRWVASTCAAWAVMLTIYLIYLHVIYYNNKLEQRCIVRILVMVIVYAVDSFAALLWHEQAVWIDVIRDTYEAYVLFTFFSLMMQYLGGADRIVTECWENGSATLDHPFPLCCFKPVELNRPTLLFWELCALQYTIINPILSVITLILFFVPGDLYTDGSMEPSNAYPWIAGIRFISVTFAFTVLVYFYLATHKFMEEKKPIGKFVSIKVIVFFSFWQSVALSGLSHFGVIHPTQFWSSDSIATGASNFLLCVEMWMIAVAHKWVFSHEPYAEVPDEEISWVPKWEVIYDIFFCSDAVQQLENVVGGVSVAAKESIQETTEKIGKIFKRRTSEQQQQENEEESAAASHPSALSEQEEGLLSSNNNHNVKIVRVSEDI